MRGSSLRYPEHHAPPGLARRLAACSPAGSPRPAAGPRRRPGPQGGRDPRCRGGDGGAGAAGVPVPRRDQHVAGVSRPARRRGAARSGSRRRSTGSSRRSRHRRPSRCTSTGIARCSSSPPRTPAPSSRPSTWSRARQVDADPSAVAAVILGDSPDELTKANLDRAFRCVKAGAELLGMHRNPWWLTPAGPTLDAGAFLVGSRVGERPAREDRGQAVARLLRDRRPAPRRRGRRARRAAAPPFRARHGRRRREQRHRRRPAGRAADDLRADRQARRRRARGGRRPQALPLRAGRGRAIDRGGRARPAV